MLSYILILIATVIASLEFDWHGIDQVALATTVAGFFFAVADYCGWEASYYQPMVDAQKHYLNTYRLYLNKILDFAHKDENEINQATALLEPYRNSHKSVAAVLDDVKELSDVIKQAKEKANSALISLPLRMDAVNKKEKKTTISRLAESVWATIGFLAFFLLIVFDPLAEKMMPTSSIITVAAFAIIMLNYLAKDLFEGRMQKDVDESEALCREMQETAAKYKDKIGNRKLVENAKKIISAHCKMNLQ